MAATRCPSGTAMDSQVWNYVGADIGRLAAHWPSVAVPEVGGLADTLGIVLGRAGRRPRRAGEAVAFEPPDAAVRRRYQLRWVLLCDRILLLGEMLDMPAELRGHHAVQCATESGGD
jgi:hypothetical protein